MGSVGHVLALAGGVGGAKLAHGLATVLPAGTLTVVVNTGDDFEHLGLAISPDLDTVMYTLAGLADQERGWGLEDETWRFMGALERLGGPTWFRLGDRDLATHVLRTTLLAGGATLSSVTSALCGRLGVAQVVAPMSDQRVRTCVHTDAGIVSFQDYFVRMRCEPRVRAIHFAGAADARPSAALKSALDASDLRAVVVCPSNPYLSIDPLLAIPGFPESLASLRVPVIAVSPIVAGQAIKGPTAKIMRELGEQPSAVTVARRYASWIDGFVLDRADAALADTIRALRLAVHVTPTVMSSVAERATLAEDVLAFAARMPREDR